MSMSLAAPRPSNGMAQGVDLPTNASDVLGEIRGSRLDFVARYYRDPASRWPALNAAEAQRLSSLGLKIVAVWESHSGSAWYFSYNSGFYDGYTAYRQAVAVGQPAGSAIYFGVDFNVNSAQLYQIDQYFRGVNAAFAAATRGAPGYKVGVYGSGAVCDAVIRARLAQYSWLSNARAWAGYGSYSGWNIRQHGPVATLTFNHDSDEARGEYGAFQIPRYAPPLQPMAQVMPPQPAPSESGLSALIRSLQ